MTSDPQLFAMDASRSFGEQISREIGVPLSEHKERTFEDGEHKSRPLESVRNRSVYVVQSLYDGPDESVNDKLTRLLFFLGAIRDAGAREVTAIAPYLCYARKDRKTESRDPVTTRYVAQLFEGVGVDRVVTLDVHNLAAFQNAFRCRTVHVEARTLFVEHFAEMLSDDEIAVISPDVGGVKRAEAFRETLAERLGREIARGFMEKKRSRGIVSGDVFVGDVRGRTVLLMDDLISSGTTMARAADASLKNGARRVLAVATHGAFVNASENLGGSRFEQIVVTDTIPPFRLDAKTKERIHVIRTAPMIAKVVERIHHGGSVADVVEKPG